MSEQASAPVRPPAPSAEAPAAKVESKEAAPLEVSDEELDAADAAEEDSEPASEEDGKKPSKKEQKAIEKRLKKLKLKVDNREEEVEIDLDNDDELIRHLQMSKMGSKRAAEKAELEKELSRFFEALQKDPIALLQSEFKMNPDQLIEQYINQQMEIAKKSPEQIEREKIEGELKALKAEREKEKEESRKKELERLEQQELERYDMLMEQALTKNNIPRNEYYVKKIADYMLVGIEAGYDVTPEDVIPLVREELNTDLQKLIQLLPEEEVEALLGEQVINKLRKRRVAKAKQAQQAVSKPQIVDSGKDKSSEDKPKDKISYRDFFKMT